MTSNIRKVCFICSHATKNKILASYNLSKERKETLLKYATIKCDDLMIEKIQASEEVDYELTTHKT